MAGRERGNALFYVLLGVVLFAALSFIITRQSGNDGLTTQLSADKADIIASEAINYVTSVKFTIQQMLDNGSQVTDLNFVLPGEAGYDTPPHMHKVFHPGGGGAPVMKIRPEFNALDSTAGWNYQKGRNVEWTPTTQTDVMYSLVDTNLPLCKAINKKINGIDAALSLPSGNFSNPFIFGSTDVDLTAVLCPDCANKVAACVKHPTLDRYLFYFVVVAR